MLDALLTDFRAGTREGLLRAARRAFALAFGVLALPGLPLGALYAGLGHPQPLDWPVLLGLFALAAVLGVFALHLARRAAREPGQPVGRAALSAAIQAGTAPAVPLLLGCACFAQPPALLAFWLLAAALYAFGRGQLPGWVQEPSSPER